MCITGPRRSLWAAGSTNVNVSRRGRCGSVHHAKQRGRAATDNLQVSTRELCSVFCPHMVLWMRDGLFIFSMMACNKMEPQTAEYCSSAFDTDTDSPFTVTDNDTTSLKLSLTRTHTVTVAVILTLTDLGLGC